MFEGSFKNSILSAEHGTVFNSSFILHLNHFVTITSMEVDLVPVDQPLGHNGSSETQASASTPFDLVGGSFSVIESDPGWSFLYKFLQ